MKIRSFFIFILLALYPGFVFNQEVAVRALLDTNKALIGDQLKLKLVVSKPAGSWNITFPVLKDTINKQIEIISKSKIDTSKNPDGLSLSQEVVITVFDTGYFEIPALPFAVSSDNRKDTLSTLPVGFQMLSVKADSTIRDIKGIYREPIGIREVAPFALGLFILALATWLLIRWLKKRKKKEPVFYHHQVIQEPASIIALRDLEKLQNEKPWLNNRIKYFHIRISEILRAYIERQYDMAAMEQTTDEIVDTFRSKKIDTHETKKLEAILRLADYVKFAKVIPDPEQNAMQVEESIEFVKETSAENKPS
ncbi:MAG TPA: hypothetical protein VK179_00290 [Bacteroidales bacterium]|nr:hypothetical protein [Bacteroidales bacterium]